MSESYSRKELEKIWKEIRPKPIEETNIFLEAILYQFIYPEMEEMKDILYGLIERVERLELESGIIEIPKFKINVDDLNESIEKLLSNMKEAYPSDIANELGVSIKNVMEVIEKLEKDKKVEEVR